ncbi:MAG: hypothetical protein HOP11_07420 [Saprospiraceae bacterium]|nr:hypothetical protein [Saprospiraceae bacterium]
MKIKKAYLAILNFFLPLILIFFGCCRYVDCNSSDHELRVKINDYNTNENLVFGFSSRYDPAKMSCYSITRNDSINYTILYDNYADWDSTLRINIPINTNNLIYLRLDSIDIDTFSVEYTSGETTCCGNITSISGVTYNNNTLQPRYATIRVFK